MTKTRSVLMIALAIQSSTYAQSDGDEPSFRPRTDASAVADLKRLREELNRATDANGAINPLGNFLERSARAAEPARLEIEEKPKTRRHIVTLPGPKLTIIQQDSPSVRRSADGFRPARTIDDIDATMRPSLQYPVTMASANLPIVGQPTSYLANYQSGPEIPSAGANPGLGLPPAAFSNPPPFQPGINTNTQPPVLPTQPVIPDGSFPNSSIGGVPGGIPQNYSTPIQNTPQPNNLGQYNVAPPTYPQPTYIQNPPLNSNPGYQGASISPSDSVRPNPNPYVYGPPFVSNAPRQFDARNMVDCRAYRQSVDPCAQPCRSNPNGYASAPYGSPFAYVPPTSMPYGKSSGYRPLIGFGQNSYDPFLGRGIVGQPVAYVDGQPFRNFIRYIFP